MPCWASAKRRAVAARPCSRISGDPLPQSCGNCDGCLEPAESWDGSQTAQKALSAILRTGQRFGVGHLIDVLQGTANEKTQRLGHDRLPTFGVGSDLGRQEWSSVFRQLVAQGIVDVAHDAYGALRLTELARPVLRGERPVGLRRDKARAAKRAPRGPGKTRLPGLDEGVDPAARSLFEALRAERGRLAREQGVPPYIIFHDTTLIALAQRRPRSLADLVGVPGMGKTKIERYGTAFLAVLAAAVMADS